MGYPCRCSDPLGPERPGLIDLDEDRWPSARRFDTDFGSRDGEVAHVSSENGRGAGLHRACRNEHVVGLSADHAPPMCPAQRPPGLGCRQIDDRRLPPICLQQCDGVTGSQAIECGQSGQDGVGFSQRMSGNHKFLASALASLKLRKGSRMVFVPGTDRRDEGADIAEVSSQSAA